MRTSKVQSSSQSLPFLSFITSFLKEQETLHTTTLLGNFKQLSSPQHANPKNCVHNHFFLGHAIQKFRPSNILQELLPGIHGTTHTSYPSRKNQSMLYQSTLLTPPPFLSASIRTHYNQLKGLSAHIVVLQQHTT